MSTLTKLRESIPMFSATEQRIAACILENSEQLPKMGIAAVAHNCTTSKSMVVQLCKKMGFHGFKDLCSTLCVEQALKTQKPAPPMNDLHVGQSCAEILKLTMTEEIRSIQDTCELVEVDALERAVNALVKARRIHLCGVGNSAVVAQDMYNKLERIGFNAHFSPDAHCQMMTAAALRKGDIAVLFSYSGQTRDILETLGDAKGSGATIITITRYGQNPIAQQADIALYVASNESLARSASMTSRLAMLTMVDVLFTCVCSRVHDDLGDLMQKATQIAARRRL